MVKDGEVYAPGAAKSLIPMGLTCRTLGVRFVRDGDGPRITSRGQCGMTRVVWTQVRQGIPCITMEQGGDIRGMMKMWRGRIGHTTYEDWRESLALPLEQELESASPHFQGDRQKTGGITPPGLSAKDYPPEDHLGQEEESEEAYDEVEPEFKDMNLALDQLCLSQMDDDGREKYIIRMAKHEQEGHIKKDLSCPGCQATDGPAQKHVRVRHEDKVFYVVHMDLSGPL